MLPHADPQVRWVKGRLDLFIPLPLGPSSVSILGRTTF